jgi:ectoine hydroxylase-related dioxygenase (phytanoyl-CoA dioxygenase family)
MQRFCDTVNANGRNDTDEPLDLGSDDHCDEWLQPYRADFVRDGYVIIPGLLTDEEVEEYERLITAAVEERKREFNAGVPLQERSLYDQQFSQCINLWEDFPSIGKLTFHPKVAGVAASLLGTARVRIWQDQALFKSPGGRSTTAHIDHPFWPIEQPQTVTAWIPLSEGGSSIQSGAMGYVPGSHQSGLRHFTNIATGKDEAEFEARDKELLSHPRLQGRAPHFCEVPRGAIAFHHGMTVHLAKPNRSDRDRSVHTAVYFADGCTRGSIVGMPKQKHPMVERPNARIEPGQMIASSLTPIAFPVKDLPPRPAPLTMNAFIASGGTMPRPPQWRAARL